MNKLFCNQLPVLSQGEKANFIAYDFTYYYIIEYLSKILQKYTIENKFHLNDYFNQIFLKNIDVWGFVMIYMPFVSALYDNYSRLNVSELKLFESLKYIIIHFLYETAITPIPIDDLCDTLTKMNTLLQNSNIVSSKTFSKSSKTKKTSSKQSRKITIQTI
jgi:hypothetical protein